MSQENVEIVRRAFDSFRSADGVPADLYDAGVEFITRSDGPEQGRFEGVEGLRHGIRAFREAWAEWTFETLDFIEATDAVVVPVAIHLRSRSGVELDVEETWAYWVRRGKIHRVEQHGTRQAALKAVGLAE